MPTRDVTPLVKFGNPDEELLPLTQCVCGTVFPAWAKAISIYEDDAAAAALVIRKRGDTRNGGFFHGTPLGRDTTWDYVDPVLGPLFAVTTR